MNPSSLPDEAPNLLPALYAFADEDEKKDNSWQCTFAFSSLAIARLIPCFILLSFFIEYIPVAFLLGSTPAPFVSLMHQLGSGSLCGGTLLSYFWACWFLLVMEQAPLFWSGNLLRSLCMDCFVSWPASLFFQE